MTRVEVAAGQLAQLGGVDPPSDLGALLVRAPVAPDERGMQRLAVRRAGDEPVELRELTGCNLAAT